MKDFIKKFTDAEIIDFNKVKKINNEFYFVDAKLKQVYDKIKKKPAYIGIFLGKAEKPSIFLLHKLIKSARRKVWVNEKGEWLFICKRDIFGNSITKAYGEIELNDFVLVLNQHDECIGYGKVVSELTSKKTVIQRMFDVGDFLRRERKN